MRINFWIHVAVATTLLFANSAETRSTIRNGINSGTSFKTVEAAMGAGEERGNPVTETITDAFGEYIKDGKLGMAFRYLRGVGIDKTNARELAMKFRGNTNDIELKEKYLQEYGYKLKFN